MAWLDFALSDAGLEEFGVRHGIHPLHLEDCRSDPTNSGLDFGPGRQGSSAMGQSKLVAA
jgi:hypothetical protein